MSMAMPNNHAYHSIGYGSATIWLNHSWTDWPKRYRWRWYITAFLMW
ncbi:MAG: hypothetical protein N6V49_01600 [Serratia symbiotica]|nr:hypothetical protein [Serratia symbiotica]